MRLSQNCILEHGVCTNFLKYCKKFYSYLKIYCSSTNWFPLFSALSVSWIIFFILGLLWVYIVTSWKNNYLLSQSVAVICTDNMSCEIVPILNFYLFRLTSNWLYHKYYNSYIYREWIYLFLYFILLYLWDNL